MLENNHKPLKYTRQSILNFLNKEKEKKKAELTSSAFSINKLIHLLIY